MKEKEYLDLLRYYLRHLPANIVEDILSDYEEYFRLGKEAGKSEGLICAELGSPWEIAKDFTAEDYRFKEEGLEKQKRPWGLIVLAGLGLLLCSPLILAGLGVVFGFVVSFFALAFALVVLCLSLGYAFLSSFLGFSVFGGYISPIFLHPLTKLLGGLACLCLGILFVVLFVYLVKHLILALKKLALSLSWEIKKGRQGR